MYYSVLFLVVSCFQEYHVSGIPLVIFFQVQTMFKLLKNLLQAWMLRDFQSSLNIGMQ
ncbi:hypothetical protein NC652_037991 [Populus alba x Populus x berolinensis]|nr:hypothetical protein NC652_037991 [Populus alba x Populus x berolinensis]